MADSFGISARVKAARGQSSSAAAVRTGEADDRALVIRAVERDPVAFAALYDRCIERVYRHCYYRTGNRADAEDLAQQTFVQAWQAIHRYRPGTAPFVAWLLTISHNLALSHHRKRREITQPDVASQTESAMDPEAAVLADITRDMAWNAIRQLKPERQQVIILRFIEGFSVTEVAAAIGKTPNNVNVIQHRALNDLRRILGVSSDDARDRTRRGARLLDALGSIRNVTSSQHD